MTGPCLSFILALTKLFIKHCELSHGSLIKDEIDEVKIRFSEWNNSLKD